MGTGTVCVFSVETETDGALVAVTANLVFLWSHRDAPWYQGGEWGEEIAPSLEGVLGFQSACVGVVESASQTVNDGVDEVARWIETMTALFDEVGLRLWEVDHVGKGFENAYHPCGSHLGNQVLGAKEVVALNGPR